MHHEIIALITFIVGFSLSIICAMCFYHIKEKRYKLKKSIENESRLYG